MSETPSKESRESDDDVAAVSSETAQAATKVAPATGPADLTATLVRKKWVIFLVVGFLSMFADQATKIWARAELPTQQLRGLATTGCTIPEDIVTHTCAGVETTVIGGFWYHRLSMNPGSAFGLFSSQGSARIFLSIVGVIAVFGMIWMLKKARTDQRVLHWALGFVVGGAVGNLIDRIYYGVVTDFILWKYKTHEWPVFNIADVVLVVGVGLMFIDIQKEGRREKAERKRKVEAAGLVKKL